MNTASTRAGIDDWLSRFVQDSLREEAVTRFVTVVDEEILRTLPEVAADPVLVDDLHRSTRHQWLSFLGALRGEHALALPAQATDLARSLARRGMEVRVLLRVYLNAHHGVFTYVSETIDRLAADDPVPEDVLRTIWRRADRWMDESVETLIETFLEERRRTDDANAVRRGELVDALLAGGALDPEAVGRELDHPLRWWQTGLVLWSERSDVDTTRALRSAADDVARRLPGGRLLTQVVGTRDLRCWVATPAEPTPEQISTLGPVADEDVSLAVGRPAPGSDGFRTTHLDATAAQRLALAAARPVRFVDHPSVELLTLSLGDLDALARMTRREVGPLCAGDKNLASIRATVLTYLTHRMNVEATAEKLFVHGNTVRYRLAKAEELLGCSLADRPRHIELALQYVAYFGLP